MENVIGSYRIDIQNIMDEFNDSTGGMFHVESRVLIPADSPYTLDKRGIIVEYTGKEESFDELFDKYEEEINRLAHKLDKRTCLYEYSFRNEFSDKEKWVDWDNTKVAYNYEL